MYTPILIRKLGQSEYGLYSLVFNIINYLTVLDLGFGNAIIVYTSKYRAQKKYDEEKKLHGMFRVIFFIIGAIATVLGIIMYFNVKNIFGNSMSDLEIGKTKIMMIILTFNLAITFSFSIYSSIISAYEKFIFNKLMSILNTLLKPMIMLPLLYLGYKSITLSLVITAVNIVVIISNYYYCKKKLHIKIKFTGFDKTIFKTIFKYSFFIFLGVLADKVNWSIDNFVLGAVSGTIAVSIYSVASALNQLFINLSTAISGVFLPKMSKMVAEKVTNKELTNEFIKIGRIQYIVIFLMASGLILFGKQFILYWAGEGFEKSYYVALILILPLCIPLIQNLGISITQAMNKHKFRTIAMCIMAVFNIGISIPLAKLYGPIGSAIGTALGILIVNVIAMNIYYYKAININIPEFWKEILKMTIPLIIPVLCIMIIKKVIIMQGIIGLIVYIIIYTLLYILIAYFLSMNEYEKNIVNTFLKRLKQY